MRPAPCTAGFIATAFPRPPSARALPRHRTAGMAATEDARYGLRRWSRRALSPCRFQSRVPQGARRQVRALCHCGSLTSQPQPCSRTDGGALRLALASCASDNRACRHLPPLSLHSGGSMAGWLAPLGSNQTRTKRRRRRNFTGRASFRGCLRRRRCQAALQSMPAAGGSWPQRARCNRKWHGAVIQRRRGSIQRTGSACDVMRRCSRLVPRRGRATT